MNYINNNIVNTLTPTELDNLKGTTSNIQTQLNQISPNVGTIAPVNQVIASNDNLNTFANKTQGQINTILANGTGGGGVNSVTLDGIQTLTNKTLTDPKLTNNIIKSSTDKNITIPDNIDTLVNLTSTQTLTNKTLTDCVANTQLITDNSTKIATTEFVKNVVDTSSYNDTSYYNGDSVILNGSNTNIVACSINIPVSGTYELTYSAYVGYDYQQASSTDYKVTAGAYINNNNTKIDNSTTVYTFRYQVNTGNHIQVGNTLSKSIIITLTKNTTISLIITNNPGLIQSDIGICKLFSSTFTGSKTSLSYKLLGSIPTDISNYALKTDLINYASMRSGTVFVGDINNLTSILTNISGAIISAQKRNAISTFDCYLDIFYNNKGYTPIIFPTIINNTGNSNSNDISVPVLTTSSNSSATFYLEKNSNAGVMSVYLQVLLLSPNISDTGQLPNQQLNDPIILNNKIISSTGNNITIPDNIDTLVNLTSTQTLTNKTLTDPKLTNNIIKSSTNKNITIPDNIDTLVNLTSTQTLTNKTLNDPILTNNIIKSSTNQNISFIDISDNIVNENSSQTLNNKTISNSCVGITHSTNDVSTKIATTQFVYNLVNDKLVKYRYKYTANLGTENYFSFGVDNRYFFNNGFANGQGDFYITNKYGVAITLSSGCIFNTGGALLICNNNPISLANNGFLSLSKYPIYLIHQSLIGWFYDATNDDYFKFEIYYYAEKRPFINIEQIL